MIKEENENYKVTATPIKKTNKHSVIQNKSVERNVINQLSSLTKNNTTIPINKNNKTKKIIIINNNGSLANINQRSGSVPANIESTKQNSVSGSHELTDKNKIMLSSIHKKANPVHNSILPPLNHKVPSNVNHSSLDVSFNSAPSRKSSSYPSKIDNWKRYGVSVSSNKQSHNHMHNRSIFQDRSYVPHSYKEYTQQMNEYKCIKFGGIGDNMGTLDWSKRFMKFKKMNLYGIRIVAEHLRKLNHNRLSPKEERTMELKKKYENSIRYKINKYGKEIMLNNLREQKKTERSEAKKRKILTRNEEEVEFGKEHTEIREITKETMESNRDEYITRLNELKESLISDFNCK